MDPCDKKQYTTEVADAKQLPDALQSVAEKQSGGEGLKTNTDGSIDVSTAKNASEGIGINCLGELHNHLNKLGTNISGELKELFDDLDDDLLDKLGKLVKENIYRGIDNIKDAVEDIGDFVKDGLESIINSLQDGKFGLLLFKAFGPIESAFNLLKQINLQIDKNDCDAKFILGVVTLIVSIREMSKNSASNLTDRDYGDLLSGKKTVANIAEFYKDLLLDDIESDTDERIKTNDRYKLIQSPQITIDGSELPNMIVDTYDDLNLNDLWDSDYNNDTPKSFKVYDSFSESGKIFSVMSKEEIESLFKPKYTNMRSFIDYENEINKTISPLNTKIKDSNLNDIIFNIGIECDDNYGESEGIYTATTTLEFIIYERIMNNISCEERLSTKIKANGYSSFYGVGNSLSLARKYSFIEALENIVNQILKVNE